MALDVTATLRLQFKINEALAVAGSAGSVGIDKTALLDFTSGTGANAGNEWWAKSGSVASGTPVTHTLSALVDDLGRTVPFAKVRGWAVFNLGTAGVAAGNLLVGNAGTHPWAGPFGAGTHQVAAPPGGWVGQAAPTAAGLAVASGSSDQLMISSASGTVDYLILLFGE